MTDDRSWFVGVDWASQKHHVCVLDGAGRKVGEKVFAHDGAGLAAMAAWILELTGAPAAAVLVAIETPHGPVVESLMTHGFQLFAINPKQLDRFRDRFSPAGAKDDSRDGEVLAASLRTDRHCLRALAPSEPLVIELREWSRITEELVDERRRLANRVRDQLWRYYPQILALTEDGAAAWFLELWALVPTPAKARRARSGAIADLLKRHRIRRRDADQVLAQLQAPAIAVAAGTTEAATAHIKRLAQRLKLVNRQLAEAEHALDRLTQEFAAATEAASPRRPEQRDVSILRSFPGLGRIGIATLLAEAWQPLQERDYHALRCLGGAAPVTKRSGKSCFVLRRLAINHRLANTLYHWARVAVQHDPRSRAKYAALRARGHSHGRALRAVADRLLAVACAMLRQQTLFDPARSLAA